MERTKIDSNALNELIDSIRKAAKDSFREVQFSVLSDLKSNVSKSKIYSNLHKRGKEFEKRIDQSAREVQSQICPSGIADTTRLTFTEMVSEKEKGFRERLPDIKTSNVAMYPVSINGETMMFKRRLSNGYQFWQRVE